MRGADTSRSAVSTARRGAGRALALRVARGAAAAVALAAASAGCAALGHLPPFHEIESGLPGDVVEERSAFGLIEERRYPDGHTIRAWRPFVVEAQAPDGSLRRHVVPPLGHHLRTGDRTTNRVWPVFHDDSFRSDAGEPPDDDTAIAPILFWGDEPSQGPYFLFFPFGGTLRQRLFADRIDVVAFPAYVRVEDGSWRSTHVLWPLIATGSDGEDRSHHRFLPFWSQTDSPATSRRTLLWPFVHWSTETKGDRTSDGWFVFPLGGHRVSRDGLASETSVLWPFFQWGDDAQTGDRFRAFPWPFHKELDRPGVESARWWWPVWGRYESPTERSTFRLWPLVWETDREDAGRSFSRRYAVPVWMRNESGPAGAPADQAEVRSWPLFSYARSPDGVESVRVPEWIPFFGWHAGETAYSDLLSVFRWRSDAAGRAAWDLPFGIVRWRRDAEGARTLTLLWWIDIPLGGGR